MPNSTKFNMTRDINGYNGFGVKPAADKFAATLTQNVESTFTVPSNFTSWIVIFSYTPGGNIWVAVNATAVSPVGGFASTNSELNPAAREVQAGDVIHCLTPDATAQQVSALLYALN